MALVVKNPPANAGDIRDTGFIPGLGRSAGGRHGNPLQYFAWRIPWTEEPGRLWSIGFQRVWYDWSDLVHTCTYIYIYIYTHMYLIYIGIYIPSGSSILYSWNSSGKNTRVDSHSWPRDWTQISCIVGRFFTIWATRMWKVINNRLWLISKWLEIEGCFLHFHSKPFKTIQDNQF